MASSIDKNADFKPPAQKAVEVKPPDNGPHTARGMKRLADEKEAIIKAERGSGEASKVEIKSKDAKVVNDSDETETAEEKRKITYSPKEVRDKAKHFMVSAKLTPEERRVLKEILGNDKEG